VVLCGPTAAARIVLGLAAEGGVEAVGVIDEGARGDSLPGVRVLSPADLPGGAGVLIPALEDPGGQWVAGLGVPAERIWRLL